MKVDSNYTCGSYVNREEDIVSLLNVLGPLSVAVDGTSWQDYLGGVIQYHCEANLNHAAQIVGYDRTSSPGYYIVRNSWGHAFGIDGYLHVAMDSNVCGEAFGRRLEAIPLPLPPLTLILMKLFRYCLGSGWHVREVRIVPSEDASASAVQFL